MFRARRSAAAMALCALVVTLWLPSGRAAASTLSPLIDRPSTAVTADPLPTAQINGVVWTQVTNGNTVYAGGQFTSARPAGAKPGEQETRRGNLLAYNLTTGQLITSFAPAINGTVKALALSPDHRRLYVGGYFTAVGSQKRYRLAAFDTSSGSLLSTFKPSFNAPVMSLATNSSTVYAGGYFTTANGKSRSRLAALRASDGALTSWAPAADDGVLAMTMAPDKSKLVIGGAFRTVSKHAAQGITALTLSNGSVLSWQLNRVIHDGNQKSGIYSLSADNDTIYGTAFSYGTGDYEGLFALKSDGTIKWMADCHGDTYAAFSMNNIVYGAGHSHFCSNIGGFPEMTPRWENRLVAYTKQATGTVATNSQHGTGYANFAGRPSPSVINYFPSFAIGSFTGLSQAVWSLTGNTKYLAAGGEFPSVNGIAQQGLVRFAVPALAPNKVGPTDLGGVTNPTVSSTGGHAVVSWKLNWDRDNATLTYAVERRDRPGTSLYSADVTSHYWSRPTVSFEDDSVQPGESYSYRIRTTDPDGNGTISDWITVDVPAES